MIYTSWYKLTEIDSDLAEKVNKPHRNTCKRDGSNVILKDIIKILHALESNDIVINSDPKKPQRLCYINPEAANITAILTRVELAENEKVLLKKNFEELNNKHSIIEESNKELKSQIKDIKDMLKISTSPPSPFNQLTFLPMHLPLLLHACRVILHK